MSSVIKAYSLKADGDVHLAKHFRVKEFACKDGTDTVFVAELLPIVLEAIRGIADEAITINSGYRTEAHNASSGGTANSQHLYGMAADIRAAKTSPTALAAIARKIMPNFGGVGTYDWGIHVDVRETMADWKG